MLLFSYAFGQTVQGQPIKFKDMNLDGLPAWEILTTQGSSVAKIYADSVQSLAPGVMSVIIKGRYGLYWPGSRKYSWCRGSGWAKKPYWDRAKNEILLYGPDSIISLQSGALGKRPIQPVDSIGIYAEDVRNWEGKPCRLYGFVNTETGKKLTQASFDSIAGRLGTQVYKAKFSSKWGLTTPKGEWWVAPVFNRFTAVTDSLFIARSDTSFHLTGKGLSIWNQAPRDTFWLGKDGYPRFSYKKRFGIANKQGLLLARDCYYISPVSDSVVAYQKGPLWGISKVTGVQFLPAWDKFQWLKWYRPGFFMARTRNYYGFADLRGTIRLSTRYERVKDLNAGLFALRIDGYWGVANMREEFLINPRFDSISISCSGLIWGRKGDKCFLLNKEGKTILTSQDKETLKKSAIVLAKSKLKDNEEISLLNDGLPIKLNGKNFEGGIFIQNEKAGYIGDDGEAIVSPEFEVLVQLRDNSFLAKLNERWGVLNSSGLPITPFLYKELIYDSFSHLLVVPPR